MDEPRASGIEYSVTNSADADVGAAGVVASTQTSHDSDGLQHFPPGHYYSPIVSQQEIRARSNSIFPGSPPSQIRGIRLNELGQVGLLHELARYYSDMPWAAQPQSGLRYGWDNDFFRLGDAFLLYGMLRYLRPRRLVEIGSGYSSAVTLDTSDHFLDSSIICTFVDPETHRLDQMLTASDRSRVEILARPVQDVSPDYIASALEPQDVLFIDGSHVTKTGSDVNFLYFEILPRLRSGVYVHIHDIGYPFEYPRTWIEEGWNWNEAYLLRALLQESYGWEIALWEAYLTLRQGDAVSKLAPILSSDPGSSFWMRRI